MSNVGSWENTQPFQPVFLPKLEMQLLNVITTLPSSWSVPLGETTCFVHLMHQSLHITEKIFLRFQCGNDILQVALEDFTILWLHPALIYVRYDRSLADAIILPILGSLLRPLSQRLQGILNIPVKFLGYFYEPLSDVVFGCALPLILESPRLEELKQTTGLMHSTVPFKIYIPEGDAAKLFLEYLRLLPKTEKYPLPLSVSMGVRTGYSFLTLKEVASLRKGDVILPDDYPILRNRVSLVFLDQEIPCIIDGKKIKVVSWHGETLFHQKYPEPWRLEHGNNISNKNIWKSLYVTISFELDRQSVMLSELSRFVEGHTRMLDIDIHTPVTLYIHDRAIGIGQVTSLNGVIGIQILELLKTAVE